MVQHRHLGQVFVKQKSYINAEAKDVMHAQALQYFGSVKAVSLLRSARSNVQHVAWPTFDSFHEKASGSCVLSCLVCPPTHLLRVIFVRYCATRTHNAPTDALCFFVFLQFALCMLTSNASHVATENSFVRECDVDLV